MNLDYAYAKIQGLNGENFLIQHVHFFLKLSQHLILKILSYQSKYVDEQKRIVTNSH